MKYYLIAGEASGDMHSANLMKVLKSKDTNAEFRFWGGEQMQAVGHNLVKHYRDTAVMGFKDVILNIRKIKQNIARCKTDVINYQPDVLILTDYAGFNLRIAKFAKSNGIKTVWYIAPKVWAWKKSRIKKLKLYTDKVMTIFPFEKSFFKENGMEVDFVGNPLLDVTEPYLNKLSERNTFISENNLKPMPIIALLPGSRVSELKYHLPVFKQLPKLYPDYQFVIGGVPSLSKDIYKSFLDTDKIPLVYGKTYELLSNAKAAVVASGTATLETAFLGVPQVCCYRGDNFSYQIAKRLVKIDYISLVNLIADKLVIKELIYKDMTVENIKAELDLLLNNEAYKTTMLAEYKRIKEKSGGTGASARAAGVILSFLNLET